MELLSKLEKIVLGWTKNVPHLPVTGQKWLAINVWWIVLVCAIITGIASLFRLVDLFALISLIGAPSSVYFVTTTFTSLAIFNSATSLVFFVAISVLLGMAVQPLQNRLKKGWVLLFMTLLVEAIAVVVNAVLSFSIVGFVTSIIFGAVSLAIAAYFISEIHGQFGHPAKATAKKA